MSLFICITIAFLLPVVESPFQVGVLVLGLSIIGAIILSAVTTWLALILFLMYVGGILVTFAYFLALCPNQVIRFKPVMLVPFMFGFIFFYSPIVFPVTEAVEICDIYDNQNFTVLVVLGLVLLFAIVRVVKIVSRPLGALRPFGF